MNNYISSMEEVDNEVGETTVKQPSSQKTDHGRAGKTWHREFWWQPLLQLWIISFNSSIILPRDNFGGNTNQQTNTTQIPTKLTQTTPHTATCHHQQLLLTVLICSDKLNPQHHQMSTIANQHQHSQSSKQSTHILHTTGTDFQSTGRDSTPLHSPHSTHILD